MSNILKQSYDPAELLANASAAVSHINDAISVRDYDLVNIWIEAGREALWLYRLCRNEGMEEPYTPHHTSADAYATTLESTLDVYVEFLEPRS
jgi:hypothetical protein